MKPKTFNLIIKHFFIILLIFPINNTYLRLTETKNQNTSQVVDKDKINEKIKTKQIEENKGKTNNEDKYEQVEIIKTPNIPTKTPTYVKPSNKDEMKSPILIQTKETQIFSPGLTERPNYLSTVIQSAPTSVTSSVMRVGDGSLTFDLESVRKKKIFDMMKSPHPENSNVMSFGNDNLNYVPNHTPGLNGNISLGFPNVSQYINQMNPAIISPAIPPVGINYNTIKMGMPNVMTQNNSVGSSSNFSQNSQNINLAPNNQLPLFPNLATQIPTSYNIQGIQPQMAIQQQQMNNLSPNIPNGVATGLSPYLSVNSLPVPSPLPIPSPDSLIPTVPPPGMEFRNPLMNSPIESNSQTFNMKVQYKGLKVKKNHPIISDLTDIEERISRINELSGTEISNMIEELRGHEQNLTNLSNQTYKNIKQYQSQNNVILESLREEIMNADNQLNSMIVEVPNEELDLIKSEIEDEFTKSLEGYTINKNKYLHLRELDPKEINDISKVIKTDLNRNDKFYLHGDFNLF